MRELAILTFISLDGVMQGVSSASEDTSGNFDRGGWAAPYWADVMDQVRQEAMATPYDMLFGRKTFELFAANRPGSTDGNPIARMMDQATKYVVSSSLTNPDWENSVVLSDDAAAEVARLKAMPGPLLQIHGSWQLIQTLLAEGLIDELRLWTFPVIVGAGKRLFEQGLAQTQWKLAKSAPCPNGATMTIYQKAQMDNST